MTDADGYLFDRWCHATGRDPRAATEDDMTAFFAAVPAAGTTAIRRTRAIRARNAHLAPPRREQPTVRPERLGELLDGCPPSVRGARDRFLIALILAGLPRSTIAHLTPADVDREAWSVGGVALEHHRVASRCARCALASWLVVLPELAVGFRLAAREAVGTSSCETPPDDRWLSAPVLLPPIDRYGWSMGTPLTQRSMARVLTRSGTHLSRGLGDTPARVAPSIKPQDDPGLYEAWGDAEDRADELSVRLAEIEAELFAISGVVDEARSSRA